MPLWLQLIISVAAGGTAVGYIYGRILKPLVGRIEVVNNMHEGLGSQPEVFPILNEIAKQFRTNRGSSLRDVVNRLDQAVKDNRVAMEALHLTLDAAKVLAESDRRTAARLEELLNIVLAKADIAAVASAAAATLAAGVATDLEDAHARAEGQDAATAVPGEAADAAMRRPTDHPIQ